MVLFYPHSCPGTAVVRSGTRPACSPDLMLKYPLTVPGVGCQLPIHTPKFTLWHSQQFHTSICSAEFNLTITCLIISSYYSRLSRRYDSVGQKSSHTFRQVQLAQHAEICFFSLLVVINVRHVSSLRGIWLQHRACCTIYILIQNMHYMQYSVCAVIKHKVKNTYNVSDVKVKLSIISKISC